MRWLLFLLLAACSGASHSTGERSHTDSESHKTRAAFMESAASTVEFGEPIFHEEDYDEGCTNGQSGDGLLVVVNKAPGQNLRCDWKPKDLRRLSRRFLVPARLRHHSALKLRAPAAQALDEMMTTARDEGVRFYVRSAYRSYAEQSKVYRYKVKEHGVAHAQRFSAEAGRSQHQLGTTVDLTSEILGWRIEDDFADTRSGAWLADNAFRFGFALSYPEGHEENTGYAYEPWHYRYIGRSAASELRESGAILEDYLRACRDSTSEFVCSEE